MGVIRALRALDYCFVLFVFLCGLMHAPPAVAAEGEWAETNPLSRALAEKFGGSESQAQIEIERVTAALRSELMRGHRVVVFGLGTFAVETRRTKRKEGGVRVRKHVRFRAAESVALEINR